MPMRVDLQACYAGLAAITLISLFTPIPVFIQMIVTTSLIIYIGANQSLAASQDSKGDSNVESFELYDAYMFPVIGSCVLFGLYLVFKIFPRALMVLLFKFYFMLGGVFVVAMRISTLLQSLCTEDQYKQIHSHSFTFYFDKVNETIRPAVTHTKTGLTAVSKACEPLGPVFEKIQHYVNELKYLLVSKIEGQEAADKLRTADANAAKSPASPTNSGNDENKDNKNGGLTSGFTTVPSTNATDILPSSLTADGVFTVSYGLAGIIAVLYLITNHWIFNNLFGICFSIQAIELINLGSYKNGMILLCGLFIYDVFWVFGTDVMVTVAKSVDAPIKLLFPQADRPSMLGLGDIVIPGIFISLMLRLDMYLKRKPGHNEQSTKPVAKYVSLLGSFTPHGDIATDYFNLVMVGYVAGLLLTVLVMIIFKAAQPALLYLVPACLASTAGVAYLISPEEFQTVTQFVDPSTLDDKSKNNDKAAPAPATVVDDAKSAVVASAKTTTDATAASAAE